MSSLTPWRHQETVMGTVVTFDLFHDQHAASDSVAPALARAIAVLHEADATFSTWKPQSPLSQLRRGECSLGQTPPDVADVLAACRTAKTMSRGWFDPWSLPGGVDPTGYVKGWAAQRALNALDACGLTGAIVNAAGDIAAFGRQADGNGFRAGIVNPANPSTLLVAVDLTGALATSGAYERGEHLYNPLTKTFATAFASASVTGPDLGFCDALATALVVGGEDVMDAVRHQRGYEAFTVAHDGTQSMTDGFALVTLTGGAPAPVR